LSRNRRGEMIGMSGTTEMIRGTLPKASILARFSQSRRALEHGSTEARWSTLERSSLTTSAAGGEELDVVHDFFPLQIPFLRIRIESSSLRAGLEVLGRSPAVRGGSDLAYNPPSARSQEGRIPPRQSKARQDDSA
jgi:hypothetical protein